MDPLTLLLIGAAVGGLKAGLVDEPAAERQRKLAASTQRYSPWTGLKANAVKEPDYFGSALGFGTAGAQVGMGLQQNALNEKIAERLTAGAPMTVNAQAGGGPYSLLPQAYGQNPFQLSNPYSGVPAYGYGG